MATGESKRGVHLRQRYIDRWPALVSTSIRAYIVVPIVFHRLSGPCQILLHH